MKYYLGLVMAGAAEAAKPKKRTRNANRVGPYGSAMIGNTSFDGDHAQDRADLIAALDNASGPSQNLSATTEDSDLGYQAMFGYRFNRYVAAELSLAGLGMRQNPPAMVPGQAIWVPPVRILERDYSNLIADLQPLNDRGMPVSAVRPAESPPSGGTKLTKVFLPCSSCLMMPLRRGISIASPNRLPILRERLRRRRLLSAVAGRAGG